MRRILLLLLALLVPPTVWAFGDDEGSSSSTTSTLQTSAAVDLFVATTGSDAVACTSVSSPCLTIEGAMRKLPPLIRHPVVITVAAGTYTAGAYLAGYTFDQSYSPTDGAYLTIKGTRSTATAATGAATGTVASSVAGSGVTFGSIDVTAAGWTTDDFRGKLLEITGGTGSGQFRMIASNDADTIVIGGSFSPTLDATSTFAVRDWVTIINNVLPEPATMDAGVVASGGSGNAAFYIGSNPGGMGRTSTATGFIAARPTIYLQDLKISVPSAVRAVRYSGGSHVQLDRVRIEGGTTGLDLSSANGAGTFRLNTSSGSASSALISIVADPASVYLINEVTLDVTSTGQALAVGAAGGTAAANVTMVSASVRGSTGLIINLPLVGGQAALSRVQVNGGASCVSIGGLSGGIYAGSSLIGGQGYVVISNSSFDNCSVAAINAKGGYYTLQLASVSGGTNAIGTRLANGAMVGFASTVSLTGTAEISVDDTTYTLAAFRALSPKRITNMATHSTIFE